MTAAVTAAAAIAIIGCGGDSESEDAPPQSDLEARLVTAQFRDRMAAICEQIPRDLRGVPMDLTTPTAAEKWATANRVAQERALRDLATVTPPPGEQQTFDQLQALLREAVPEIERAQKLAMTRDPFIKEYLVESNRRAAKLQKLGASLDIRPCWGA